MLNVLLVANNPLSEVDNNGKTISSMFSTLPDVKVLQLYFRDGYPNFNLDTMYYLISDKAALMNMPGLFIESSCAIPPPLISEKKWQRNAKNSHFIRLLREVVWKIYDWEGKNNSFLEKLPLQQGIFFCAGDSLFAYDIVDSILDKYALPLIVYITDDYIYPQLSWNPLAIFRRKLVRRRMVSICERADHVITISDKMRDIYSEKFGISSTASAQISKDHKSQVVRKYDKPLELVYAGGLHYARDKVLSRLISAIEIINRRYQAQLFVLRVFSKQNTEFFESVIKSSKSNDVVYEGLSNEIDEELKNADILVFAESSDLKNLKATWLSLSTKVPEYLSFGKPILNLGSMESNSVSTLSGVAINSLDNVESIVHALERILQDESVLDVSGNRSYQLYKDKFSEEAGKELITTIFKEVYNYGT